MLRHQLFARFALAAAILIGGVALAPSAYAQAPGVYLVGGEIFERNGPQLREDFVIGFRNGGETIFLNGVIPDSRVAGPGAVLDLDGNRRTLADEVPIDGLGTPSVRTADLSEDGSVQLVQLRYRRSERSDRPYLLADRDGNRTFLPEGVPDLALLSADGRTVASWGRDPADVTSVRASRWSVGDESFELVEVSESLDSVVPSAFGLDGRIILSGYELGTDYYDPPGTPEYQVETSVLVWRAGASSASVLTGFDENGTEWTATAYQASSRSGESIVSYTTDGGPILRRGLAVFREGEAPWFFSGEYDDELGRYVNPTIYGVTDDGTIAVGSTGWSRSDLGYIWTKDGESQSLSTYLALAGLDVTGWTFERAVDISSDGTRILGVGTLNGSDEYIFVAVIPEPSTALLVGLGLIGLARRARCEARSGRAA